MSDVGPLSTIPRPLTDDAAALEPKAIKDFYAYPVSRDVVMLTWEVVVPEWPRFRIVRTVDGGDPTTLVVAERCEQYLDERIPGGSMSREISYEIYLEGGDGKPMARAIVGDTKVHPAADIATTAERILLTTQGFPCVYWNIRSSGDRCPDCYDPVRRRVSKDNCEKCSGTGRVRGYSDPRVIYMLGRSPEQRNTSVLEAGEYEQSERHLWTNADTRLRPRDVLALPDGRRYRVEGVVQHSLGGTRTRQDARCLEVNPNDVESEMKIPDELVLILQRQPNRARML